MSQSRPPYRRKQYFIKKGFQFKFIFKFCVIVIIGALISTGVLFLSSKDTLTSSFQQSRLVIKNTASAILPAVIYTNLITLILITAATIAVTLFISHKLAGPMFRFEKELKGITGGDLTKKIILREKDQITDMADSLNMMIAGLHGKVSDIRSDVKQLAESASQSNAPEEIIKALDNLHKKIGSSFKI